MAGRELLTTSPQRRAAVLGSPVTHSLSPVLHAAAYAELGLDDWTYDRVDVIEGGLEAFLDGLGAEWVGLSLTMPLKQVVVPLLDETSPLVDAVGVVNTVTFGSPVPGERGRRRRRGDNTDVAGIVGALRETGVSGLAEDAAAVVLGGGATAASAVAALVELGCREPAVVVRSTARAGAVAGACERLGVRPRFVVWRTDEPAHADALVEVLADAEVVVSTAPARAADAVAALVGQCHPAGVLLDVVYDPWPTALTDAWASGGGAVVDGLAMLVHQAVGQVALWTGRTPSVAGLSAAVGLPR